MRATKTTRGGRKFLGVILALGAAAAGAYMSRDTEPVQRVLGHREDHRLERTMLMPRFSFASARLRITVGEIYNDAGSPVDLTATRDVSIDRQSQSARSEVIVGRTPTAVEPGVEVIPFDASSVTYTEILTKDRWYESPQDPSLPWSASPTGPGTYGTEVDEHFIPMIDDIMGFEMQALASQAPPDPVSGLQSTLMPRAIPATPPSDVATIYTFKFDLETYRRAAPILASRTDLNGAPQTEVTLTIGFDRQGLLRFADVAIPSSAASLIVQSRGAGVSARYHYLLSVDTISGEPLVIDVPANVVDAPAP